MSERELTPFERAVWGECPVCHAKQGDDCNPDQGIYGVHFGRISRAPRFVTQQLKQERGMAAYKVGTTVDGTKAWWAHWEFPHIPIGMIDVRDATEEEAALMEKVVWKRDSPTDRDAIREMIAR